jgi:ankyrin repeat protein
LLKTQNCRFFLRRQNFLTLTPRKGRLPVVKLLVGNGAELEVENEAGETALHLATKEGHISTSQFLVEKGAHIEATTKLGNTPLHLASCQGHFSIVQVFCRLCNV